MEEDCYNCYWYVYFDWKEVEVCCYHKIMIVANEGKKCRAWKHDDIHVNDAVDGDCEKGLKALFGKE